MLFKIIMKSLISVHCRALLEGLCKYTGGRKSKFLFVRHWRIWQFYRKFFPIELVKTCDLDPNKTYMFCSHPHGILCSGAFCAFNTEG